MSLKSKEVSPIKVKMNSCVLIKYKILFDRLVYDSINTFTFVTLINSEVLLHTCVSHVPMFSVSLLFYRVV